MISRRRRYLRGLNGLRFPRRVSLYRALFLNDSPETGHCLSKGRMLYWLYDTRASVANELQLEIKKIKEAVVIFRTINNRFGLQILDFLHQNKRSSVKPVYNNLGLQQTVTSSHLTALRKAGLVSSEKEGKFVYYSVNYRRLEEVGEIAEKLLKY